MIDGIDKTVQEELLNLYQLQEIDRKVYNLTKQRSDIPNQLNKMQEELQELQGRMALIEEQVTGANQEAKGIEGILDAERHKVRKWEQRLNEIRNQREYLALSREIESLKRANTDSEEKILELMKTAEEFTAQADGLREELNTNTTELEEEQGSVDTALKETDSTIEHESARRDDILPKISKPLLKKYDFIRSRRMGVGLALIKEGQCTACNMRLPPQLYNILQAGQRIDQCPSCQRIMLWEKFLEESQEIDPAAGVNAEAEESSETEASA